MIASLTSPTVIRDLLRRHQLSARKKYGQNFLCDEHVLQRIVDTADLDEHSIVLEIGPGIGCLTKALAAVAKKVIAIEIDNGLEPLLAETLGDLVNVVLIFGDALKLDLGALLRSEGKAEDTTRYDAIDDGSQSYDTLSPVVNYAVVANLPYYITTPLLLACLQLQPAPRRLVFLVQQEVATRLTASCGSKLYGSLSVYAQAFAEVRSIARVAPTSFYPAPEVTSTIVSLQPYAPERIGLLSRTSFELTNRALFGQRRKTITNALIGSPHWNIAASDIQDTLQRLKIDGKKRGEELSVSEIIALANALAEYV